MKELTDFFEAFANDNNMLPEEAVKELEARLLQDNSEKVAKDLLIYLDLFMVIPTFRHQQKLYITIMAYLLNELVSSEYPLTKAVQELKWKYESLQIEG